MSVIRNDQSVFSESLSLRCSYESVSDQASIITSFPPEGYGFSSSHRRSFSSRDDYLLSTTSLKNDVVCVPLIIKVRRIKETNKYALSW